MQNSVTRQELFNACQVLFGREVDVSVGFLNYLQLSGVKSAYRRKALETHPDRAAALSGDTRDMAEGFKALNEAYKRLSSYVENPSLFLIDDEKDGPLARWPLYRGQSIAKTVAGQEPRRPGEGKYHTGPMPASSQPLARFLYYSGAISYETLIAALVWQRMQRKLLGALAARKDWLSEKDALKTVVSRLPGEKFGECAVRRGLLTVQQVELLLGEQKRLPLIGSYFCANGLLTPGELGEFLARQYSHNRTPRRY